MTEPHYRPHFHRMEREKLRIVKLLEAILNAPGDRIPLGESGEEISVKNASMVLKYRVLSFMAHAINPPSLEAERDFYKHRIETLEKFSRLESPPSESQLPPPASENPCKCEAPSS